MSADPFAGYATLDDAPVVQGAVQTSAKGNRGRVDTATSAAVPVDPFASVATMDGVPDTAATGMDKLRAILTQKPQSVEQRADAAAANVTSSPDAGAQALFPRAYQQLDQDGAKLTPAMFWQGLKDVGSLPGRVGAGMIASMAEGLGNGSNMPSGSAFLQEMAAPTGSQGQTNGAANLVGGLVKDPMLPGTMATGNLSFLPRVGATISGLTARDVADQAANGQVVSPGSAGKALAIETAGALAGEGLANGTGRVARGIGTYLGENFHPGQVLQRFMKPTSATAEGLHEFGDAGLSPLVRSGEDTKQQVGQRFLDLYPEKAGQPMEAWKASADATAAQNPALQYQATRAVDAMEQGFQNAEKYSRGAFSKQDKETAMGLVLDRLNGSGNSIMPSATQSYKSQFLNEGFGHEADRGLAKAKETAFKAVGGDMRDFLASNFPEYAPLMKQIEPWVAAKPAMTNAAIRGGNNNLVSLQDVAAAGAGEALTGGRGLGGLVMGLGSRALNGPNASMVAPRLGREFMSAGKALPKLRAPLQLAPGLISRSGQSQ